MGNVARNFQNLLALIKIKRISDMQKNPKPTAKLIVERLYTKHNPGHVMLIPANTVRSGCFSMLKQAKRISIDAR